MKSEQELIDEIKRSQRIEQRLEDHDESERASAMRTHQHALLWAVGELDTTEVDISESVLRVLDRQKLE